MANVIIVLGGSVNDDETLVPRLQKRVDHAIELFRAGNAPHIIMTGGWSAQLTEKPLHLESPTMKKYAVEQGIPADSIFIEAVSRDTVGNAYFTKTELLEPHNWTHVIVVTTDYHVARAQMIFEKVLGPSYKIECTGIESDASSDLSERLARERKKRHFLESDGALASIPDGDTEAIKRLLKEYELYKNIL
jgi:uncharacterized SAM-binding protein YcdF (DUF218 family)